jgi:hypothetical protein
MKEHAMRHTNRTNCSILFTLVIVIAGFVCSDPVSAQVQTVSNTAFGVAAFESGAGFQETVVGSYALWQNQFGGDSNTAVGYTAMYWNTTGIGNTASGNQSLNQNRTGYWNTASGNNSMFSNTTGYNNAATGNNALACNTTGAWNTAFGAFALSGGTFTFTEPFPGCPTGFATGSYNTASGAQALYKNTTGYQNTAAGSLALFSSTVGNHNTASGSYALYSNTNGNSNTADGDESLYSNTTGYHNTASGSSTLFSNTTGISNVALGLEALYSNTTGSNNIAVGTNAGYNLTFGNNDIDIGNEGVAGESGIIRLGTPSTQVATYIAGIENARVTGAAVYVTASGQLGVLASSERYKTAIAPMGAGTEKLSELRPVSFHLKSDPKGAVQYGLIAEAVAKVYPELVIRDEAGKIQGVRYDELAPMLLNEMQKQKTIVGALVAQHDVDVMKLDTQAAKIASLDRQLAGIQAALVDLQPKHQLVAQR